MNNWQMNLNQLITFLTLVGLMIFAAPSFALYCATPGNQSGSNEGGNIDATGKVDYFQPANGTRNAGTSQITLAANPGSRLNVGDMILIIQMQGAEIDRTNSISYGDGVSDAPASGWLSNANFTAGFYEYAKVSARSGTTITLAQPLVHTYVQANANSSLGKRRYQVVRVPQYNNLTLTSDLTAKAWDGNTGGVLPLDVASTLDFNGKKITMSEKGFRGGGGRNHTGSSSVEENSYRHNASTNTSWANASKGEGIAGTPRLVWTGGGYGSTHEIDNTSEGYPSGSYGMGAPGNAGGGGTDGRPSANDENSGGGGGGNGGAGGRGGNSWSTNLPTGGYGGAAFTVAAANRVVMGGGGGAGSVNNRSESYGSTYQGSHGGVGGGIVLIRAGTITGNGTIESNGGVGPVPKNDGAGGGGAGGSIIVTANNQVGSLSLNAKGGNGADVEFGDPHGPGGGGGGGVIFANSAISAALDASQGQSGMAGDGSASWPYQYYGATPSGGVAGSTIPNLNPEQIDGASPGADCWVHQSDLSIVKTRNSGSMTAGGTTEFLIKVTNNGPDATVAPIIVSDNLDAKFTYTGFTGTGWNCTGAPSLQCTYTAALANGAQAPDLLIQADIASTGAGQAVSNTASVALTTGLNNSDPNPNNNSSTIDDIIYNLPASGVKLLYAYPDATGRKLSRVVPSADNQTNMASNTTITLPLTPTLSKQLIIGNNPDNKDIYLRLCMKPQETSNQSIRQIEATLYRGTNANTTANRIGTPQTVTFSNHNWLMYIFKFTVTSSMTISDGTALNLRLRNVRTEDTRGVSITNNVTNLCEESLISRVEINTDTVINVDTVGVYSDTHPAGVPVSRLVQGQTVYVRAEVSDPFGHEDINNNSTAVIMDGLDPVGAPFPQTRVISAAGNQKHFEYQITVPAAPAQGFYDVSVLANEGTEGDIFHAARTSFELTTHPDLTVTKTANKSQAASGDIVEYTVLVANKQESETGDAHGVEVKDKVPRFTYLKVDTAPIIDFTDGLGLGSYGNSGLSIVAREYSSDNGSTWTHVPTPDADGVDKAITDFKVRFSGKVPPNGAFQLKYSIRLQ